jgi:suppressor of tumorigenicity protein 13
MASSTEQIMLLHQFVDMCKKNSDILHDPQFAFYREYLESLGATIPPKSEKKAETEHPPKAHVDDTEPMVTEPDEDDEPLDIDNSGVIEPETDTPLPMGDPNKSTSDEDIEKANDKRDEAMAAFGEGNFDEAVKLFTEAIELNPGLALLHAKRANALLKLRKPVSAIRDCDKAIAINPDSAQAYKFRGRAKRLLGHWVEAYHDLGMACKLDYDDTANEWLKEVEPNAKKIIEHNRKKERTAGEKLIEEKKERVRRAQEAHRKAEEERRKREEEEDADDLGDVGGMPPGFAELFNNPEIVALLKDQETMAAYMDIMQNPQNIAKHITNPKVMKLMELMQKKAADLGKKPGAGGDTCPASDDVEMGAAGDSASTPKSSSSGPSKVPEPDLD